VMAVAFKCVRRAISGSTLDAAIAAFDHFVETRLQHHLSYIIISSADVQWVGWLCACTWLIPVLC
jgi:hypothetical protein